jgi:hypothetical protein
VLENAGHPDPSMTDVEPAADLLPEPGATDESGTDDPDRRGQANLEDF